MKTPNLYKLETSKTEAWLESSGYKIPLFPIAKERSTGTISWVFRCTDRWKNFPLSSKSCDGYLLCCLEARLRNENSNFVEECYQRYKTFERAGALEEAYARGFNDANENNESLEHEN